MTYEKSEEADVQIDQHNDSVVLAVIKSELTFGWGATEMHGVDPLVWSSNCDQQDANANYLSVRLKQHA